MIQALHARRAAAGGEGKTGIVGSIMQGTPEEASHLTIALKDGAGRKGISSATLSVERGSVT